MLKKRLKFFVPLLFLVILPLNVFATEVTEADIPDAKFRQCLSDMLTQGSITFKTFYTLEDYGYTYTTDGNKYDFTKENLDKIKMAYCKGYGITDLTGLSLLTNLESLDVADNKINSIKITSSNSKIKELIIYNTGYSEFTVDDSLTSQIASLNTAGNGLKTDTINGYISRFPNLYALSIGYNYYTGTLDVSSLKNLNFLDVYANTGLTSITGLPSSSNTFYGLIVSNTGVSSVDVSGYPNLTALYVDKTKITSLDLSKNTKLLALSANSSSLSNINGIANLTNLNKLDLGITKLSGSSSTIVSNLPKFTNLQYLDLEKLGANSIDLSKNTKLTHLNLKSCKLTSLDVSMLGSLNYLEANLNSNLSNIKLGTNSNLKTLDIRSNQSLKSVNLSGLTNLEILGIENTPTDNVDFSASKNTLTSLDIDGDQLKYYDFTSYPKLTKIQVLYAHNVPVYNSTSYEVSNLLGVLPSSINASNYVYYSVDESIYEYSKNTTKYEKSTVNGEYGKDAVMRVTSDSITHSDFKGNSSTKLKLSTYDRIFFVKLSSKKYAINESNATIDVGGDNDETILSNISTGNENIKTSISGNTLTLSVNKDGLGWASSNETNNFKTFTLLRTTNPKTGDIFVAGIAALAVIAGVVSVIVYRKKIASSNV